METTVPPLIPRPLLASDAPEPPIINENIKKEEEWDDAQLQQWFKEKLPFQLPPGHTVSRSKQIWLMIDLFQDSTNRFLGLYDNYGAASDDLYLRTKNWQNNTNNPVKNNRFFLLPLLMKQSDYVRALFTKPEEEEPIKQQELGTQRVYDVHGKPQDVNINEFNRQARRKALREKIKNNNTNK